MPNDTGRKKWLRHVTAQMSCCLGVYFMVSVGWVGGLGRGGRKLPSGKTCVGAQVSGNVQTEPLRLTQPPGV